MYILDCLTAWCARISSYSLISKRRPLLFSEIKLTDFTLDTKLKIEFVWSSTKEKSRLLECALRILLVCRVSLQVMLRGWWLRFTWGTWCCSGGGGGRSGMHVSRSPPTARSHADQTLAGPQPHLMHWTHKNITLHGWCFDFCASGRSPNSLR